MAAAIAAAVVLLGAACGGSDGEDADRSADPPAERDVDADADLDAGTTDATDPTGVTGSGGAVCRTVAAADAGGASDAGSGAAPELVDATAALGLVDPLVGMYGHATAAADVDADGWTDLFVAGFADRDEDEYRHRGADGPAPDRLLLGGPGGFRPSDGFTGERARTSGATFADLDGDGDLDLVVARNPRPDGEIASRPTTVYDNRDGTWAATTTLADDVGARSVAALDVDRDGLVDLAVLGDRFGGGPTRFLRNTGGFAFEDATEAWGVPDDVHGLALATVDLDGDGWLDVVTSGDERVLLGGPDGFTVVEVPVLRWEVHGDEDDAAGIAVGDLDGDGRPDLAVGQHFNSTVDDGRQVPVRLFLNRSEAGAPALEDVTEAAGSPGLPTKSPHVAIVDLDDDGLADVVTSAAAADGSPLVLHNTGVDDGVPRLAVVGEPGDGEYWVTGVTDDLDQDGRVDLFLVSWEPAVASPLFRGEGGDGAWVEVDVAALGPALTGARVEARVGDDLVATGWAASTTGYAAGAPPVVRLGLGAATGDVSVTVTAPGAEPRQIVAPVRSRVSLGPC
ncbi:MAG TPA: VCBS repeat-containing protein [Acidimicrobiales bacterium]|nr:VCBS repeat-containing protein [Acidimicrobiales bacterium]